MVEMLSSSQLRVDSADAYTQAMNKIRGGAYHLLLAEYSPLDLDGFKLLHESSSHLPDALRIVLLANDADDKKVDAKSKESNPIVRYSGGAGEHDLSQYRAEALAAPALPVVTHGGTCGIRLPV